MSTDIIRAFIADALTTMTIEEMRNIIKDTPDNGLEAVGARVLAEKRKKTAQIIEPGVEVPVGDVEGAEEGGPATKIAKKSKTVKKKVVAKKPVKKVSALKDGPSKRKYDAIDITSDSGEETPESIRQEDEANYDPSFPQGSYATGAILRALQSKMANPLRYKLWQLAIIIDHLDWDRVHCRAEMIRHLSRGLVIMDGQHIGPTTMVAIEKNMADFVNEYQAKFQYHPMFTAAYKSDSKGPKYSRENHQPGSRLSAQQVGIPPYDWKVIAPQLSLLDGIGRGLVLYELVQGFCSSYDNIIQQHVNFTSSHAGIEELVGRVDLMSILAANMSSTLSREIKYEMRGDKPMSKLRDCMAKLCAALGRYKFLDFVTDYENENQERQKMWKQLGEVDKMLRGRYPGPSFKSGIEKVHYLF